MCVCVCVCVCVYLVADTGIEHLKLRSNYMRDYTIQFCREWTLEIQNNLIQFTKAQVAEALVVPSLLRNEFM
jgi:hypothetical protein